MVSRPPRERPEIIAGQVRLGLAFTTTGGGG